MADGSVTIKVDMDGSNAQSGVSKLKALFGGLENAGSKVGSVFKSVLGANLISSALTTGIGTITSGIREMASELNSSQKAWKTFEGNLQAFRRLRLKCKTLQPRPFTQPLTWLVLTLNLTQSVLRMLVAWLRLLVDLQPQQRTQLKP